MADRIVRDAEASRVTGLGKSQRYRLEKAGKFPSRRVLTPGGRSMGYLESELLEWVNSREAATLPTGNPEKIGSGRPGPGRPRKAETTAPPTAAAVATPSRRGPGRPRKGVAA